MRAGSTKATLSDQFGVKFDADETIRLIVKPNVNACIGNEVRTILLQFLVFAGLITLFQFIANLSESDYPAGMTFLFFGIVSCISFGKSVWKILELRKTTYAITDLNVIIHTDFNASSTRVVNIKDIKTRELKKTIVDKYYRTGSIHIFTGQTRDNDGRTEKVYDTITSVSEPEKTFALLSV